MRKSEFNLPVQIAQYLSGNACVAMAGVLVCMAACTPVLNWRQVPLQELRVMLPCKPDNGERSVLLAGERVQMQMVGCEVQGALLAISRVEVATAAQAKEVQANWQDQALTTMRKQRMEPTPWKAPSWAQESVSLHVWGSSPDGSPLQARMLWLRRDARVYHLVVYAAEISPTLMEPLLMDIQSL